MPWLESDGKAFPDGQHIAFTHWSIGGADQDPAGDGQVGVWQYCSDVSGDALNTFMLDVPLHGLARAQRRCDGRPLTDLPPLPASVRRAAIVSGYFNPLHIGHLDMMEAARGLADALVVIVNNDAQQVLKKGKVITSETDRLRIVEALRVADAALVAVDDDGSVAASLEVIHAAYPGRRADLLQRRRPRPRRATPSRRPRPWSASGSASRWPGASAATPRPTPPRGSTRRSGSDAAYWKAWSSKPSRSPRSC